MVSDIATGKFDAAPARAVASAKPGASAKPAALAVPAPPAQRRWLSPLTARILAINLLAPGLLTFGVFYLDQFRAALIDARVESLFAQGELISGALGEYAVTSGEGTPALDPPLAQQMVRRLVAATESRARLFDETGRLIADSRYLSGRAVVQRPLPPPSEPPGLVERVYGRFARWLGAESGLPLYRERATQRADDYAEALSALHGEPSSAVRDAGDGNLVISVAVPVQGLRQVIGALMLNVDSREIDHRLRVEQIKVLGLFAGVLLLTILLSLFLAGTIVRPIKRLAEAADKVRAARGRRIAVPDFGGRRDEIGGLAASLGEMTEALYRRLDAIEAFAADVSHEIKNPLTSLRSAVETLARTNDPEKQRRLTAIVTADVDRLARLISDISNASRIDAELARIELRPVDLARLLAGLVQGYRDTGLTGGAGGPRLELAIAVEGPLFVLGDAERLGQVARNLLDNAVSFSPPGGRVIVAAGVERSTVWFAVEDDGPGIPDDRLESIFDRFYSDRPAGEAFGTHSGLGLSISRQIVESFGGIIEAANRRDDAGRVVGARFVVRLPQHPAQHG
jgi:two-component system, OmpR family, sensor histidine kinase ChvG